MTDLRFALIGCGGLGRIHVECVAGIPGGRFVAYADVSESAAESALHDFGGDYATTDPYRVISDDSIDAVYVCTHHDSHAPLAIAAARAGKHILMEKPMALTLDDCEAMADAVGQAGVTLMPALKYRFFPLLRQAREFIPQPQVLVGQMMDARWSDDNWAQDPVTGGANVYSQGNHVTDMLRYLAGSEPVELWAAGGTLTHPGHPCIDQCVATIKFANGHVASWIQGDAAPGKFTGKFFLEAFGEGRSAQIHAGCRKAVFFDGDNTREEEDKQEGEFHLENQEFVASLKERREPCVTMRDGVEAVRIVVAADRAIRTGEVQRL